MPDKLLGIYEYLLYDAPNGSVEGKSAGELVDYMCYGTYQRYAKGREENFAGLPKSKYGPYSLKSIMSIMVAGVVLIKKLFKI